MTAGRRRTAVLISGRGSNMEALLAAARAPDFPAEIVLVLANDPGAKGLATAQAAGVAVAAVDHRIHATREAFEGSVGVLLDLHRVDLVCLAGFMRLLSPAFVEAWAGRLLNIHPSLLPAFPGLRTHARALDEGVRLHGCTVHFVVARVDAGPIVAQSAIEVRDDDTAATLATRVLAREHAIYPRALGLVASGAARLEGGRVVGGFGETAGAS